MTLPLAEFASVIVHTNADRLLNSAHDVVDVRRRRRRCRLLLLTVTSVDDHLESATGSVIVSVIQTGGRAAATTTTSVSMMTTKLEYGARGVGVTAGALGQPSALTRHCTVVCCPSITCLISFSFSSFLFVFFFFKAFSFD